MMKIDKERTDEQITSLAEREAEVSLQHQDLTNQLKALEDKERLLNEQATITD